MQCVGRVAVCILIIITEQLAVGVFLVDVGLGKVGQVFAGQRSVCNVQGRQVLVDVEEVFGSELVEQERVTDVIRGRRFLCVPLDANAFAVGPAGAGGNRAI